MRDTSFILKKKLYKLTDGDEVYDIREMDSIEYKMAQHVFRESTDGNLYWKEYEEIV